MPIPLKIIAFQVVVVTIQDFWERNSDSTADVVIGLEWRMIDSTIVRPIT
jgi:hypothetical protein